MSHPGALRVYQAALSIGTMTKRRPKRDWLSSRYMLAWAGFATAGVELLRLFLGR